MDTVALRSTSALAICVRGETLHLLPERAAYWPAARTLVVADIHFGKSATFREHGMPVPEGDTQGDLERLDTLVRSTGARRLIIAGDLLHAASGQSPEVRKAVARWRRQHSALNIALVSGNHDRSAGKVPEEWLMEVHRERLEAPPFAFVHDPADIPAGASPLHICGHLHPAVALAEGRIRSLKAPCFWLSSNSLVLPGFGMFTGSRTIHPGANDSVYAVTGDAVIAIPAALLTARRNDFP